MIDHDTALPGRTATAAAQTNGRGLQRRCACGQHTAGGPCAACRARDGELQRSAVRPTPPLAPPIVHQVLRSPGQPLDTPTRRFMEPRFRRDFSGVRVHTDSRAARSADAVDSAAYAVGRHLVFGAGQFQPDTADGSRLLAHELAHVGDSPAAPPRERLRIAPQRSPAELDAEAAAEDVVQSEAVHARTTASGQVLHRSLLAGLAVGGAVGAIVGGLAGGLMGAGIGLLAGLAVGLIVAAIVDAVRGGSAEDEGSDPHSYWATQTAVSLSEQPTEEDPTIVQELPADTRVAIAQSGSGDWVKLRVTTGPLMGVRGWARRSQLVERRNTVEVTPEVAVRLFNELAQATFLTTGDRQAPIPFHYPPDGCYARAEHMADLLIEKGYEPRKVFAVSRRRFGGAGLRVPTPYAGDVPAGTEPAVEWWYHVAPIIKVRGPDNRLVDMVIDPSILDQPAPISEWTARMSGERFEHLSLGEVRELVSEQGGYPVGRPITFTTPTNVYVPPGGGGTGEMPDSTAHSRATMTAYARRATTHELAAAIRRQLATDPVDVDALVALVSAAPIERRRDLRDNWPGLLASLRTRLPPADQRRVLDALEAP